MQIILAIISLSACSSTHTFVSGDGKNTATVTADNNGNGTVSVRGADGKSTAVVNTGSNASYPTDIPFAQYPGSKVTICIDQSAQPGACKNVTLDSADAPSKTMAYYKDWFTANNWKVVMESNQPGMSSIAAQKDNQTASIMSMPDTKSSHTNIQIVMSSSK